MLLISTLTQMKPLLFIFFCLFVCLLLLLLMKSNVHSFSLRWQRSNSSTKRLLEILSKRTHCDVRFFHWFLKRTYFKSFFFFDTFKQKSGSWFLFLFYFFPPLHLFSDPPFFLSNAWTNGLSIICRWIRSIAKSN